MSSGLSKGVVAAQSLSDEGECSTGYVALENSQGVAAGGLASSNEFTGPCRGSCACSRWFTGRCSRRGRLPRVT